MNFQDSHRLLLFSTTDRILDHADKMTKNIPKNLLRESIKRLCSNLESFMFILDRFIKNYSVVCIAGYILGIGDRHLENFLLNI